MTRESIGSTPRGGGKVDALLREPIRPGSVVVMTNSDLLCSRNEIRERFLGSGDTKWYVPGKDGVYVEAVEGEDL